MTTTPRAETRTGAGGTQAVALQLSELVLKTARYDDMAAFYAHVLGHGPFYERTPDPDVPPRQVGMPERAVDVRIGVRPHRAANHGQATSFYYRDPDRNIVEFSCPDFATVEEEVAFMSGPVFAANPSGLELDPDRFAARHRAGDSERELLRIEIEDIGALVNTCV